MKSKKNIYPTEKETLQTLFALVFGVNREQIGSASSRDCKRGPVSRPDARNSFIVASKVTAALGFSPVEGKPALH